jgi:hypothetical protein
MKSVKDGATIYNTFPVNINISGAKTFELSGEDDKTVTVNYNNTATPVVTNS